GVKAAYLSESPGPVGLEGTRLGPRILRRGFTQEYLDWKAPGSKTVRFSSLGHKRIAMRLSHAGQAAATARRGSRQTLTRRESASNSGSGLSAAVRGKVSSEQVRSAPQSDANSAEGH